MRRAYKCRRFDVFSGAPADNASGRRPVGKIKLASNSLKKNYVHPGRRPAVGLTGILPETEPVSLCTGR